MFANGLGVTREALCRELARGRHSAASLAH
jgi:hypothetical protein